jgi:hypothetical protein
LWEFHLSVKKKDKKQMKDKTSKISLHWTIAFWILLICWVAGACLNMARVHGGFLTNYLSDLTFPPWFYIFIRGLRRSGENLPKLIVFGRWFGVSPERAVLGIFSVGAATEFKTLFWPGGPLAGTFDLLDIAAYATGLLVCYYFDKKHLKETRTQYDRSINDD